MFRLIKKAGSEYRALLIKKKNGKSRQFYAPKSKLKKCQMHILLHGILSNLLMSQYATAYRKGGTPSLNAQPHMGKKYLLKLDISDFVLMNRLGNGAKIMRSITPVIAMT